MKLLKKKQKQLQQVLMKKMQSARQKISILIGFLLVTIALLMAVSIYCYLIKYKTKQKHSLPFNVTNTELKGVLY